MNAINIQPETAQKIAQMAAERHIEPETLVNEILAEYFASTLRRK
jgi:hypothetical protein